MHEDSKKIDYGLHYRFVYFNSNYLSKGRIDKDEYNSICLRDAERMKDVQVVPCPLDYSTAFIRRIYNVINHKKLPRVIKRLWYPFVFKTQLAADKPFCFIVANSDLSMDYLAYLKKKYPKCKLVKLHRDLVKISHMNPEYSEENMNRVFDLRMSYDPGESAELGFPHFDEIESKIEIPIDSKYPLSDVFFAGKAKNRLPKILTAYEILSSAGLKCDFYITGVPKEEQVQRDGITYANGFMPYIEMLYRSVNTRCMLDINQEGAVGYTSRFLEAVIYNKRLIADNPSVLESKYYNPDYIQIVDDMKHIDPEFVNKESVVDYHYDGDFSPIKLIKKVDKELIKMEEKIND